MCTAITAGCGVVLRDKVADGDIGAILDEQGPAKPGTAACGLAGIAARCNRILDGQVVDCHGAGIHKQAAKGVIATECIAIPVQRDVAVKRVQVAAGQRDGAKAILDINGVGAARSIGIKNRLTQGTGTAIGGVGHIERCGLCRSCWCGA
ncbi:hypothetical protein TH3_05020 [Thalassospira xiamenensis M-5 = DSM 17429]|uniref:Uncharacterized protein n=1 Tax=Thalassospira xiamenensis M-5 = DSM 17429 TaxID=1123366 RepID=A0AB72UAJ3_9PROT|nr:hypothetical protein TH3_05020 [Thalassospira xiamenensis M-5 = DSM 17429]